MKIKVSKHPRSSRSTTPPRPLRIASHRIASHRIPWHTMPPKGSLRGRTQHREADKEPETPFHPTADAATFRDLLIFEERLKQNAARLQARKRKYEMLLFGFISFIVCLSHFVVISPRSSVFLQYSLAGVLMICLTTLFLFFASGMHAERIRSANKFVPQANRSLRNFNMHLNTRIRSAASSSTSSTSSWSIPPAQNSRGELIFSSRVSPEFREGYERYRAAFERRRAEKMAAKRAQSWKRWLDYVLGKSSHAVAKPNSTATRRSLESRPRTTRSSKPKATRTTRASTRANSATTTATPCHVSGQLEDLSDTLSEAPIGAHSDGLSEGVSDEPRSLSGHEPS